MKVLRYGLSAAALLIIGGCSLIPPTPEVEGLTLSADESSVGHEVTVTVRATTKGDGGGPLTHYPGTLELFCENDVLFKKVELKFDDSCEKKIPFTLLHDMPLGEYKITAKVTYGSLTHTRETIFLARPPRPWDGETLTELVPRSRYAYPFLDNWSKGSLYGSSSSWFYTTIPDGVSSFRFHWIDSDEYLDTDMIRQLDTTSFQDVCLTVYDSNGVVLGRKDAPGYSSSPDYNGFLADLSGIGSDRRLFVRVSGQSSFCGDFYLIAYHGF